MTAKLLCHAVTEEDKHYYAGQIHESINGTSIASVPGKYWPPLLGLLLDPKGKEQEGV